MPIPDFQSVMLPLLRDLAQGDRTGADTHAALAAHFALSAEELAQRLPSGRAATFANRIGWAKTHLKAAGLIESPRRAVYRLTARGRRALAEGHTAIGMAYLGRFSEYVDFRRKENGTAEGGDARGGPPEPRADTGTAPPVPADTRTPDELIEDGYRQIRRALVEDIRERIASMPPGAFEQLVVDVLRAMGYGGPAEDSARVIGGSGDEGIDGVIREDRLGLEMIYLQAKRWQSVVGRPEIQRFAGALQGQRARKGVFITTSSFTREAEAYARSIQTTIVLVDGAQLAELMIDHGVGVTTSKRYEIRRLDSDYFASE